MKRTHALRLFNCRLPVLFARDVKRLEARAGPQLGGERSALVVQHVANQDGAAFRDDPAGLGATQSACRTA